MPRRPPGTPPQFATDATYAAPGKLWNGATTKLAPPSGRRAQGWRPGDKPNPRFLNYLLHSFGAWLTYVASFPLATLKNWVNRTASFNALASSGITSLQRAIYDEGDASTRAQALIIGGGGGGNAPPLMASYTGDGWFDTHSGGEGTNYTLYDGAYVDGDGVNLWVVVGDSHILTHVRDLSTGSWASRTPGTASKVFSAIAHGAGALHPVVVVGEDGTINTSDNGTSWTARTSGTTADLNDVAWSPTLNLYVAVGSAGVLKTSPDGATWTSRTSGTLFALIGVVWDPVNELFVAIDGIGVVRYSADGITWSTGATASYPWGGGPVTPAGLATDGQGTVITYALLLGGGGAANVDTVMLWASTDGGLTWSRPIAAFGPTDQQVDLARIDWCGPLAGVGSEPTENVDIGWVMVGPHASGGPGVSVFTSMRR